MPDPQHSEELAGPVQVTTVADRAAKAYIEPYGDAPTMRVADGVIGCVFCTNTGFRRSRVRFHDVLELLLLRYPMRCMRCNQRQYGYFLTAAFASSPRSHNGRIAKGQDTWKAWTETEAGSQPLQRPMTTAAGTRATSLHAPHHVAPDRTHEGAATRHEGDRHIW